MNKTGFVVICISSVVCLMFLTFSSLRAQTAYGYTIDSDIYTLRNDLIPGFSYHYDDYLQYAPAGVMVGLKAFGYEGRSSWGRMLASDAFSAAIMACAVNGVKYSVARLRPDGSRRNSFPSGHTATTFMTAAMLSKEYGWRSPWFSIGGYTVAAVTGISRIMNNRHWLTDVLAGAAIGIGSVHLGYYLADLIFKDRHICDSYVAPSFVYDASVRHYVVEMLFARRFILGSPSASDAGSAALPLRGSLAGLSADIPVVPGIGVSSRASVNTLIYPAGGASASVYSALAGGYYNLHFAKRFEIQTKVMAGYAWQDGRSQAAGYRPVEGWDFSAGIGLSFMLDSNFKVKAFSEFESMQRRGPAPWLNSILLGFSTAWLW